MGKSREFEISFVALKPGIHEFTYEVDDKFFAEDVARDFSNCTATIKLQLDKKSGFMLLKFEIGGKADVECDRCGNKLTMDLWDEFNMLVKMVDNPDEMNQQEEDPDVYYISRGESHLAVKNWIYEFINLSIPMQKTCEFENMDGPFCNPEARALLNGMKVKGIEQENPIWNDLKKFRDLE